MDGGGLLDVLPWSDVPDLISKYEDKGMEFYGPYVILRLFHTWHEKFDDSDTLILAPGGKVDEHGTFLVIFPAKCNVIIDSLDPDVSKMKPLLAECIDKHVKWTGMIVFGPTEKRFWPVLDSIFEERKLKDERHLCKNYYMDKEQAKKLELVCPDEVYLGPLKEENAELINSLWPHRFEGSIKFIKLTIRRNGGVGVFLKENDELVSWAGLGCYNEPQLLQTVESHKRKGYGYLAAMAISKYCAERDLHPCLYILDENTPSRKLFDKLGYKRIRDVMWCCIKKE